MGTYYKKRLSNQLDEAREIAIQYKKIVVKYPLKKYFMSFFGYLKIEMRMVLKFQNLNQ